MTLGDVFCNVQEEIGYLGDLFDAIAYIAGAALIGQGLYLLVRYNDNPASTPLHQPLNRMAGGAALLASPSVANAVINTLFYGQTAGGLQPCTGGGDSGWVGDFTPSLSGDTPDVFITNLVYNIKDPLTFLLSAMSITIGFFLIVRGLIKASKYGMDPREYSMSSILANLVVGAVLMVAGESSDVLMNSVFGGASYQTSGIVGSWNFVTQLGGSTQFIETIQACGLFFEMIGMIAFIRGWLILKRVAEGSGQATMAQGLTHVFGGVLAMNIFQFLQIIDNTIGTNWLTPTTG